MRFAAVAALGVWCLVAVAGGGMDLGTGLGGRGPFGAFAGLALLAPLAAVAAWSARTRVARGGPPLLALAAALGLAAWSGVSVGWALEPSLAWLAANRDAAVLCALLLGLAAGAVLPRAPERFPVAFAAAAAAPVGLALATVALPTLLGEDGSRGRLESPVGYPNALALVAAMAVPGTLLCPRRVRGWAVGHAAPALLTALATCTVLALSRGGVVAALLAAAVTLALAPRPRRALAVLAAGLAGAVPAIAVGLGSSSLTTDGLTAADRAAGGALFGPVLLAGMAAAIGLAHLLGMWLPHGTVTRRRGRRVAAVAAVAVALLPVGALAMDAGAIRDCGRGAVANDPGRLAQVSANQRGAWWCAAGRGWREAPVAGNGAGSWPLVERRERTDGDDRLLARGDPHQLWLSQASALGAVGLVLLLALWGAVLWAVLRLRGATPAGLAAILAAALLQAQTDWVLTWPAVAMPVAAAAGLLTARAARGAGGRVLGVGSETALAVVLATATVALVSAAALPWLADRAVRQGADALAHGDVAAASARADSARGLNPTSVAPLFLRARARSIAGDTAGALRDLGAATDLQPDNPATWRRLAMRLGDDPAARRAWIRVHLLDPYAADARAALGIPPGGAAPSGTADVSGGRAPT